MSIGSDGVAETRAVSDRRTRTRVVSADLPERLGIHLRHTEVPAMIRFCSGLKD